MTKRTLLRGLIAVTGAALCASTSAQTPTEPAQPESVPETAVQVKNSPPEITVLETAPSDVSAPTEKAPDLVPQEQKTETPEPAETAQPETVPPKTNPVPAAPQAEAKPEPPKSAPEQSPAEKTVPEAETPHHVVSEHSKELVRQADELLFAGSGKAKPEQAAKLYYEARKEGNPVAMRRLAAMYRRGVGFPRNLVKAFEYVHEAASLNDPAAQSEVASLYLKGEGVQKSRDKAKFWLEKAANNGYTLANILLSEMLSSGHNAQERAKAEEYIQKVEKEASPQSLYTISYAYARGARLPKSETKAAYWARQAAAKGEPNAAHWLGGYLWKTGNLPEAVKYFEQASEAGIKESTLAAGHIYRDGGEGVRPQPLKAVSLLEKVENLADEKDARYLLQQYLLGPKEIRNKDAASKWLNRYAENADTSQLQDEAEMYWNGKGVRRNFDLGGLLALAALKKGDLSGVCDYAAKLAVPNWKNNDYVTAYSVLDQCALDMPQETKWGSLLDKLQAKMTAEQIQEAQEMNADEALEAYIQKKELKF